MIVFSNVFLIFLFFPHGDYEELWLLLVSQSMLPQVWFESSVVEFAYLKNGHFQGLGEGREG